MDFAGYADCPVIENEFTRVILGPHCGGRVLEYSWKGANGIFLDPEQDGWTRQPGEPDINPCGGRLDIGPEMVVPEHPMLWLGPWNARIIGPSKAEMVSQRDEATGVQLIRTFELPDDSSHLRCTQTIRNVSSETREYCHWSRTLAPPAGLVMVPLTPGSRFPKKYIMYTPAGHMDFRPDEANISIRDGFFLVDALPKYPKLVLDSTAGWFAYLMPDNLLFVKKFPVYPDRVYNEMAGITVCIYYHEDFCELEPIGPRERIEPGQDASFTEDWWLLEYEKPSGSVDLRATRRYVRANTSVKEGGT